MFSDERIEEIIKNANSIIHKADNGESVSDGDHIARHQLRDLSVLAMYLYDYYRASKKKGESEKQ